MNKKCYICKILLTSKTAYKDISKKNMLMSKCKKCSNIRLNERRRKNGYYRSKSFNNEKREKRRYNSIGGKYRIYKHGAKVRNYEFEITKEEFMTLWQKNCVYCGNSIETIGIDRVNNKKGYILDNIVSCCIICNRMKMTMDKNDFIEQCKKIINFNNLKN